jgi:alpha-N-arabinofuranosidase
MTPEYYSDLYRRFSVYARDWGGNRLERVAAGPGARSCSGWTSWPAA